MAKTKSISLESVVSDFEKLDLEDQVKAFKLQQSIFEAKLAESKQKISEAEDAIDKLSEVIEVGDKK